jgi:hypothetical protein
MQTWHQRMPPDMLMRSAWEETSLSAPGGAGTLDRWAVETGEPRAEPIPLQLFLRYAEWFRERFVRDHDRDDVALVERAGERGYRVTTTAGAELDVRSVVAAIGVTPFLHAPSPLGEAIGEGVDFAVSHSDFTPFGGRRVLVVGAGQAGLESAGLAARAGATVEILARSGIRWFADREPHHPRGAVGQRLYRLAYPAVGYGPPPINRLVLYPDLFATLPFALRERLTARLLRPGGSAWVRGLVDGKVAVTVGATVTGIRRGDGGLRLALSDGSEREVDDVLLATGYRFDLDRLPALAPLRSRIRTSHGWPILDRSFRATEEGLFFVGYPAEGRFGPISRFVLGCEFTARRVRSAL